LAASKHQKESIESHYFSHDLKKPNCIMLGQTLDLVDKGPFEEGEFELILKKSQEIMSYHLSGMLNNTWNWVLAEI